MSRSVVGVPLEGPWTHAGISVTCHTEVSSDLVAQFWPLYEESFGPLRIRAAARHVLTHEEFVEEVTDPRVWKYVATGADGVPIGLTTLSNDLATVPWISPEYYAHHYPEQWSRRAVFYMGFTMVKPGLRHSRAFFAMLQATTLRVAASEGVCGYDVCGYNDSTFDFGAGIERLLHRLYEVQVAAVDQQTYYAVTFSGRRADRAASR